MGCCTELIAIPEWLKPGTRVICIREVGTSIGTTIEVGARGVICHVDEFCAKVIGIEGQYPGLQVVLGGPDFLFHWDKAP